MATVAPVDTVHQIGMTAGLIWQALEEHGPVTVTRLLKLVPAPRDLLMQALGWLAREDKVVFDDSGRTRTISLRETLD
jgi:hypothetical protein